MLGGLVRTHVAITYIHNEAHITTPRVSLKGH
jgi:hypothetical protein